MVAEAGNKSDWRARNVMLLFCSKRSFTSSARHITLSLLLLLLLLLLCLRARLRFDLQTFGGERANYGLIRILRYQILYYAYYYYY